MRRRNWGSNSESHYLQHQDLAYYILEVFELIH